MGNLDARTIPVVHPSTNANQRAVQHQRINPVFCKKPQCRGLDHRRKIFLPEPAKIEIDPPAALFGKKDPPFNKI